jgi:hypothetical protein
MSLHGQADPSLGRFLYSQEYALARLRGGKDGTSDISWTWIYRDNGAVSRYEQDGTDHFDAPVIDGEPDLTWTFSPDCDLIGDAHPWIYNQRSPIDVGQPTPSVL